MKRLYWHLSKVSWQVYMLISILSILGLTSVEVFKVEIIKPYYEDKIRASNIMQNGLHLIKAYRIKNIKETAPIDYEVDPATSGLIGLLNSPITSSPGNLEAKRTSVNPNWAAVIVDMLKQAKVKKGDAVAMGFSGSFPAINLAALSAVEALNLEAIAITDVASSSWGANISNLTWLDMENILYQNKVIRRKSIAASLGGRADQARGMSEEGKQMLQEAIQRNNIPVTQFTGTRGKNINSRMDLYQKHAGGKRIAAYINVGGGTISVGTYVGKKFFRPGLNLEAPPHALSIDSVMKRFIQQGVPVIHMLFIRTIAKKYGLPVAPKKVPGVGEGRVFKKKGYRNSLVVGVLVFLILALYVLMKVDIGYRIFSSRNALPPKPPEPMV